MTWKALDYCPVVNLGDRDLADAGVYGGKVGHFFGDRMDWLGVEMEAFNTTPHVEQQGLVPGSHFRVTTLAFNLIGRLKLGCETKTVRTEPRSRREGIRYETRYEREFCRLQPYGGVGLGVFFANLSNNGNSVSDNAVPGLNALAGVRYYFTERIALFAEYKYNWAVLEFDEWSHRRSSRIQRRLSGQSCGRGALVPLLGRARRRKRLTPGCGD